MGKLVMVILAVFLAVAVSSIGEAAETQRWKIGHVRPEGSAVDKDIRQFVDQIDVQTQSAIRFEIYPGNKLGDYSVVQERVSFGEVEMYVGPFGTSIDKRLALAFTPFLVSDWAQAKAVYHQGSALFKEMAELLAEQNIHLVGGWPVYFGGIGMTQKPTQPGNPDLDKQMIIRVPPIRCFERTARELGFTPYPITWTYAKMGLKTGMVAGIMGGGAEGYLGLKGILKYYLPVNDHFEYWFIYVNRDAWNRLPQSQKTLLTTLAGEMEQRRYAVAEAAEADSIDALAREGVAVIPLSDGERRAIQEKIKRNVWPEMRSEIGAVFDRIAN